MQHNQIKFLSKNRRRLSRTLHV